jgi:hypothetical protein
MSARRTLRLTPVAAADHQRPIGLVHGRVDALVTAQHDPTQADRMPARAGPADLLQPALALGITRPRDQAPDGLGVQLVDDLRRHRGTSPRGHKTDTSAREHADTRDNDQSSRNAHRPGQTVPLMTHRHQAFQPLVSLVMNGVPGSSQGVGLLEMLGSGRLRSGRRLRRTLSDTSASRAARIEASAVRRSAPSWSAMTWA